MTQLLVKQCTNVIQIQSSVLNSNIRIKTGNENRDLAIAIFYSLLGESCENISKTHLKSKFH